MESLVLNSQTLRRFFLNPLLPWIFLFFFSNLAIYQDGGTNALSRIAGLRAITESNTIDINRYVDWTFDWSRSPNGKYYSNKAPGGVLLGLPVFAITEIFVRPLDGNVRDQYGRRLIPSYWQLTFLCFFTQILPLALLVFFIGNQMLRENVSPSAVSFFALATLFGNTAALYMNSYFGHGLTATVFLATTWFWWRKSYSWAGFFLGLSVLCDYSVITILPAFAVFTFLREKKYLPFAEALLGAILPTFVFAWYHSTAFGSPFALASQFINPNQIEKLPNRTVYWGTFSFLPDLGALQGLLVGGERGLLGTQPWILFLFTVFVPWLMPKLWKNNRDLFFLYALLLMAFFGLLWMNAGVGGWQGGRALGPRYLSSIFFSAAILCAYLLNSADQNLKILLWTGLTVSLAFRLVTFPFSTVGPYDNLWRFHLHEIIASKTSMPITFISVLFVAFCLALVWYRLVLFLGKTTNASQT